LSSTSTEIITFATQLIAIVLPERTAGHHRMGSSWP
jgi:hypothetical protein